VLRKEAYLGVRTAKKQFERLDSGVNYAKMQVNSPHSGANYATGIQIASSG